jgi:hypothetical protein
MVNYKVKVIQRKYVKEKRKELFVMGERSTHDL